MKKTYTYTEEQLREAVEKSFSIAQTLRYLGLNPAGQAYNIIKKRIKDNNIDTSHFTGQLWSKGKTLGPKPRIPLSDILDGTHKSYNSNRLRKRLISEGLFEHKCYKCNNKIWNGNPIPLELEHIDGNHDNNRLENLTILCPNCHAQTETYRGKNIKSIQRKHNRIKKHKDIVKSEKLSKTKLVKRDEKRKEMLESGNYCISVNGKLFPKTYLKIHCTKEDMERMVWENPTTKIAELFGVSDKAIEKFCKRYGIIKPPRGYWAKKKALN